MIRAVIGDTWRQSRQQVVFIVMLAVMLVVLVVGISLPRPIVNADGSKSFGTVLQKGPDVLFARLWTTAYYDTLLKGDETTRNSEQSRATFDPNLTQSDRTRFAERRREEARAMNEAVSKASGVPEYQRAVEYYVRFVVSWMFRISMLLFIAVCAGYFPAMLGTGAVDVVLSKPLSRLQIYSAKYFGGIALFTAAIVAFCTLLFIGIGVRTGVFHYRIFYAIPLLVFTSMLLYSMLALIGTASRSATMAIVTGYVFYVVIDFVINLLLTAEPLLRLVGLESSGSVVKVLRTVLPNFSHLNDLALASLLNMPIFDFAPFAVALVWLFGCFGLGYWIFKVRDY